jgi:hypothetical protein
MGPRAALLIAVTVIGALNTSTSGPSRTGRAASFLLLSDTTAYADQGDLRILDTIRSSTVQPTGLPDPSIIRLGADTFVMVNITTFPPSSMRGAQATPGQPGSRGMRLVVSAFARDTVQRELHFRRFNYSECPVELKLFRSSSRRGRPVWNSRLAGDTLSCPRFQSHDSTQFSMEWPVRGILGDSLPAARYHLTIALHLADGRVVESASDSSFFTADPSPPTHDLSAIRFRGSSTVGGLGPRMLQTKIVATNISRGLAELDYGSCVLTVSLFGVSNPAAAPVWRSNQRGQRRRPSVQHVGYACTMELRTQVLAPADSNVFESSIPLAEVLADSLAFGRYRVEAKLGLLNQELRSTGWNMDTTFDLGEVSIAPMPDSMPRTRTINGVRYTAASRVIRGKSGGADTVRTMVLMTNPTTRRIAEQFSPDCPVVALAFRTTADRDSLPFVEPVWAANTGCPSSARRFELEPGQRVLLYTDKPISATGATIPSGRYYILASFWVASSRGQSYAPLNAGTIDVGR